MTPPDLINTKFESLFGWIALEKSRNGITRCSLPQPYKKICVEEMAEWISTPLVKTDLFSEEIIKINQYLEGIKYSLLDIPLDLQTASKFYRNVWETCRSIPLGYTKSYKWVAEKSGHPNAARAVGQAMANNKITLIIPCHRVVGVNGSLTGFGKSKMRLDLKLALIELETNYFLEH